MDCDDFIVEGIDDARDCRAVVRTGWEMIVFEVEDNPEETPLPSAL